ncbi:MAG TPA: thiolase family protein [Acidimicrobiia bacterium]|nr:thiolase family protein [Acidimicrobiia bacterium]
MRHAYIVDAVRSPIGKRNGGLRGWHPVDLSAVVVEELLRRTGVDPQRVDDVIWGCVSQTGEQGLNLGRWVGLAAGLPETVPGVTIDRQCGSSQQAVHFAAQGIMAGAYDIVIAGGVESMTRVPMGSTMQQGPGFPFGPRIVGRYALVPQGLSAEMVAERWGLSRERLDTLALESHRRTARAIDEGRFAGQIVPIPAGEGGGEGAEVDEGVRRETSLEALGGLKPAFRPDGVVTAGNSSQISDGAGALLVAGEDVVERMGWKPLARVAQFAVTGVDPVIMLTAPIPATAQVLARAGLGIEDVDLFEVNEAFASVVAAWLHETGADWEKVNVNGGAIAVGHPLGGSGAILMTRLLHEMKRTGARRGLQAMCEGGGTANATLLELVS